MASLPIEEGFGLLEKAAKERPHNSNPKIQRVANRLRNRKDFEKHYSPKLVSIGPIHRGDANLELGEKYKLMWAAKYIKNSSRNPKDLHKKIADNIEQLKGLLAEDVLNGMSSCYNWEDRIGMLEEKLSWVLFVDGCALLHILEKAMFNESYHMNVKVDQLILVMMDVLLLENQIPYLVLKLLWRDDKDESALIHTMRNFLKCHHFCPENNNNSSDQSEGEEQQSTVVELQVHEYSTRSPDNNSDHSTVVELQEHECSPDSPAHLLDLQRRIILPVDSRAKNNVENQDSIGGMITYKNIQEMIAAGIRLKSSKTGRLKDVSFSYGWLWAELTLPEIVVDDTTAATFLNLIAYEMCPDFLNDYEICVFAAFMHSLIDHPEDVKALRSAGILLNSLGSDEEVANLFKIISIDLVPDTVTFSRVRDEIVRAGLNNYRNKLNTWIALAFNTYFSNPWAIIAFFAALLALVLTFVQTWFAIHPPKS